MRYAHLPVKEAVISPSALSLMYPAERHSGLSVMFFGTLIQMRHGFSAALSMIEIFRSE